MFGTKHTKEAQSWIQRLKGIYKGQPTASGGKGPNKNGAGAGTFPKERNKIVKAYDK